MTEDKWGNRDPATQFQARMDRATSDRQMAEWIREDTEKSDTARAIGLLVFFILFFTVGMISKGKVPTSLIILFVMFLIACILALFSRKS